MLGDTRLIGRRFCFGLGAVTNEGVGGDRFFLEETAEGLARNGTVDVLIR